MKIEVKVPSVGESVTTADIESWEKQQGDFVKKGEVLVISETDNASMEVPAEQEGKLEILKSKGEQVSVDEVIATIDSSASVSSNDSSSDSPNDSSNDSIKTPPSDSTSSPSSSVDRYLKEAFSPDSSFHLESENFSPAVRHLLASNKIQPSLIKGKGRSGRLTKEDVLKHLDQEKAFPTKSIEKKSPTKPSQVSKIFPARSIEEKSPTKPSQISDVSSLKPDQKRETMTRLRRVTADRLVRSQHETATLTTFNEVDLSRIIEIRKSYQEDFVKKYGFKLGFMSFFVKAVVVALKEFPKINAFIEGTDIIYNDSQHIGIAVSTNKGLVVPVLFHAEKMSLAEIEKQIIEYRDKALARKLSPDDLLGGTFTISNGGVFGSLLSTPILNPPQSGILGMHKIEQRVVVREGKMVIRPMMYLALSYDHRMVDGRESVSFLVKVREGLEEPSRLLIDI